MIYFVATAGIATVAAFGMRLVVRIDHYVLACLVAGISFLVIFGFTDPQTDALWLAWPIFAACIGFPCAVAGSFAASFVLGQSDG